MHTVKRFNKGDELIAVQTSAGTVRTIATSTTYAVMNKDGKVAVIPHPFTNKPSMQIFGRKATAQRQADWMNK